MAAVRGKVVWRFEDVVMDRAAFRLTVHGVPRDLEPKSFRLLEFLVENRERAVSKEEIVKAVWSGTAVSDNSLTRAVAQIRKALGDDRRQPRYIETVPTIGYRFVARVEESRERVPDEPTASTPPVAAAGERSGAWYRGARAVILSIAVAVLVLGALLASRRSTPAKREVTYTPITDFTDSAIAPALSPDGRTVAFLRGTNWFLSSDQIWLKSLPDGEPVQLTRDPRPKFAPAFSPDGSRIAYSVVEGQSEWRTYVVEVLGGEPRLLMPNTEGLTWLDHGRYLFSEIKTGLHMGVATSRENRAGVRDVYLPEHERAMAHFSYASPDRKSVLVIEMDGTAAWQPCRLVPFDGSSRGRTVGPPGQCTAAGWSPNGEWMYFTVGGQSGDHLWRERLSNGHLEQLTFGPAEAQGVAVAPDGRSVLTSIGMRQSSVWMRDARGERPISSVGTSFAPVFTRDGKHVYYLLRRASADSGNELWRADVETGQSERVLGGFSIVSYDISDDGTAVLFDTRPDNSKSRMWIAGLDGRSAPRRIGLDGDDAPFFGASGQILFRRSDGQSNYLYRMNGDGSGRAKAATFPMSNVMSVSPDGRWTSMIVPLAEGGVNVAAIALNLNDGSKQQICSGYCRARWSRDGRYLYVTRDLREINTSKVAAIPIPRGKMLPDLPASGIRSFEEAESLAEGRAIEAAYLAPGPDPRTFAYVKGTMHRNLFRITLP
jgi:DNA-binding winged helix-turn-helix (wHTH) protein/Tol biopolymer transport system component